MSFDLKDHSEALLTGHSKMLAKSRRRGGIFHRITKSIYHKLFETPQLEGGEENAEEAEKAEEGDKVEEVKYESLDI